jgi:hypothetical protein
MTNALLLTLLTLAVISLLLTPRQRTVDGFYAGQSADGSAPSLITLVFSQVTTWIFARSLLTAAILGFYYGIGGALAYTAYYISFFTGAVIVDQIRFRHGFNSVQAFLTDGFGPSGTSAYNLVVALRLLSEVFANLIVDGIIFGAEGSALYLAAASIAALFTLAYSMMGPAVFAAHPRVPYERVPRHAGGAGVLAHRGVGMERVAARLNCKACHRPRLDAVHGGHVAGHLLTDARPCHDGPQFPGRPQDHLEVVPACRLAVDGLHLPVRTAGRLMPAPSSSLTKPCLTYCAEPWATPPCWCSTSH